MRVLLTGASGFVGRQCYRVLKEKGHEVVGMCYGNILDENMIGCDLVNISKATIFDLIKSLKVDTLLHTAWDVSSGYRDSPKNLEWLSASLKLVEAFYEAGGERAMTLGTCFEDTWNQLPKASNDYMQFPSVSGSGWYKTGTKTKSPMKCPHTLYGLAKKTMYENLNRLAEIKGLNYVHAKLFYLYGPNEASHRLVPSVVRTLLKNERVQHDHGNQIRDFMYVEDVAEILVTLLTYPGETGAIEVGTGVKTAVKELIRFISIYLNKVDYVDYGVVEENDDPIEIVCNVGDIQNHLRCYSKHTLDQGLAKTIEWIKENHE